jgi:hypothetical protein
MAARASPAWVATRSRGASATRRAAGPNPTPLTIPPHSHRSKRGASGRSEPHPPNFHTDVCCARGSCGYGPSPTTANDCLSCMNQLTIYKIYPNGTGMCLARPIDEPAPGGCPIEAPLNCSRLKLY